MTEDQERELSALFVSAQDGDRAAYERCLTIVADLVRRYARGRAGDVPWVDDVVQETLLSMHGARHTFDRRRPFAPWVYAIARSRLIDVMRREQRVTSRELATDTLPEPTQALSAATDHDELHIALQRLPTRQRTIVEGLKFEDESIRTLSSRLGMSETAVKVTAHRGYKALRRLLGDGRR